MPPTANPTEAFLAEMDPEKIIRETILRITGQNLPGTLRDINRAKLSGQLTINYANGTAASAEFRFRQK